jgi:S-adenosylmethionine hydrolase
VIVTLLTDYGRDDDFVGVCHGVIRGIHPEAEIVDITHGIERYAVRQGALVLRNTLPYMPIGVHVAVVDPQVGTERRALALRTGDGRTLIGPDNGLLSLAWERCDGVELAVDVTRSPHRSPRTWPRAPRSPTRATRSTRTRSRAWSFPFRGRRTARWWLTRS